ELPPQDPGSIHQLSRGQINAGTRGQTNGWTAVMGCVPYPIELDQLTSSSIGHSLERVARNVSGTLRFDIGELQVSASRESLKYGEATVALLIARINGAIDEYVEAQLREILDPSVSLWQKRLRVGEL